MSFTSAPVHSSPEQEEAPTKHARVRKVLIALPIIAILLFVIIDSQTNRYIQTGFESFLEWISNHLIAGMFALITVYAFATVCLIPGAVLTIGSGFVYGNAFGPGYGVALASCVVFAGASIGALLSFLLGRYLMRDWVGEQFVERYPLVKALDEAIKHQGLKIFTLLRLSPIIPFNVINYVGGVTAISFRDYALALFGILPGTVLYCFIGASAGSLIESGDMMNGTVTYVSIGVGVVIGLLAVYVISIQAKKEFNKIVSLQEQQHEPEEFGTEESIHRCIEETV